MVSLRLRKKQATLPIYNSLKLPRMRRFLLLLILLYSHSCYSQYQNRTSSGINLDAYERVLRYKQDTYERNIRDIEAEISDVEDAVRQLELINKDLAGELSQMVSNYIGKINKSNLDYTDFNTVSAIRQNLRRYKRLAYESIDEFK